MAKGKDTTPIPGSYDPLPAHLVTELVAIGFKAERVDSWSVEKARLTLRRYQIQTNATLRKADDKAEFIDNGVKLSQGPIGFLRADAAVWIHQAIEKNDPSDLLFAVQGGVGELSNDELRRLGDYMMRRLAEVAA
jgi:hypothetical protein